MSDIYLDSIGRSNRLTDTSRLNDFLKTGHMILDDILIKAFHNYNDLIKRNLYQIKGKKRYYYRPDYVAYDEYGDTNLWTLVLYANNVFSCEEFNLEIINLLEFDTLNYIISNNKISFKDVNLQLFQL